MRHQQVSRAPLPSLPLGPQRTSRPVGLDEASLQSELWLALRMGAILLPHRRCRPRHPLHPLQVRQVDSRSRRHDCEYQCFPSLSYNPSSIDAEASRGSLFTLFDSRLHQSLCITFPIWEAVSTRLSCLPWPLLSSVKSGYELEDRSFSMTSITSSVQLLLEESRFASSF